MSRITILGGGAFGGALAVALAQKHSGIDLWMRAPVEGRILPRLPNVTLPENVSISGKIVQNGTTLLAVSHQNLSSVLGSHPHLADTQLVACCKGLDVATGAGPVGIIDAMFPGRSPAVLTGPSFAADIAAGLPTALTLACKDHAIGKSLQSTLSTDTLRLYRTADTTGAELGGALKNVMAIACGIVIGAGLGESARAALIARGFTEMRRYALAFGAQEQTLQGLSGLGDLTLTCTSTKSRNFRHGIALGEGTPPDTTATVEGVATAQALARQAKERGIDMPITQATALVLTGALSPKQALTRLFSRPLIQE